MRGRTRDPAPLSRRRHGTRLVLDDRPAARIPLPSMIDDWSAIERAPRQLRGVLRLGMPERRSIPTRVRASGTPSSGSALARRRFPRRPSSGASPVSRCSWSASACSRSSSSRPEGADPGRDRRWLLVAGVPLVADHPAGPRRSISRAMARRSHCSSDAWRSGPYRWSGPGRRAARRGAGRGRRSPPGRWYRARGLGLRGAARRRRRSASSSSPLPVADADGCRGRAGAALASPGRRLALEALVAAGPCCRSCRWSPGRCSSRSPTSGCTRTPRRGGSRLADLRSALPGGRVLASSLPTLVVFVSGVALVAALAFDSASTGCRSGCWSSPSRSSRFAADTGILTSRYSFPPFVLAALALARSAVPLGTVAVVGAGLLLAGGGLYQAHSAHDWVAGWVDAERSRETIVRAAAARVAGGCEVRAVGLNVELVAALPVLMPLAHEPPRGCTPGERFVVVIDRGAPGTVTPPDNPILAACRPERTPVETVDVTDISGARSERRRGVHDRLQPLRVGLRRGSRGAVREGRPLDRALPALRAGLPRDAASARRARRDLRADLLGGGGSSLREGYLDYVGDADVHGRTPGRGFGDSRLWSSRGRCWTWAAPQASSSTRPRGRAGRRAASTSRGRWSTGAAQRLPPTSAWARSQTCRTIARSRASPCGTT